MKGRRLGVAALVGAALLRLALAPLRSLSADEAYYFYASRHGIPWAIRDHPPLLGALLSLADHVVPGPIELRVRLVAVLLQLGTALGVARIARRLDERAWTIAAVLATWGLMPTAGGLLATPDAPLLCALAWTFALSLEAPTTPVEIGIALLSAASVLSKVSAVPVLLVFALAHVLGAESQRGGERWRVGRGAFFGLIVALPLAWSSLRLQIAHVLGEGPLVSAPKVGPIAALGALVVGQLLLWSPPLVVVGVRALRDRSFVAADRAILVLLAGASLVSALISGRPPEPNWLAPAALLLFVAVSIALVDRPSLRRWVVAVAAAPALVAIVGWIAPVDRGPFARVPHRTAGPPADAPAYGLAAWRCLYERRCEDIDVILTR